jgi:peroxiredoxin (alkyl hydroperoxide reductase subunit C)
VVSIGERVPDFEVPAYRDGTVISVRLSRFLGSWVVLCFYPGDFTFVCPTELTNLAINYDSFRSLGAEVITISVDSVFVHKAWEEHELGSLIPQGRVPSSWRRTSAEKSQCLRSARRKDRCASPDMLPHRPRRVLQAAEILAPSVGRNIQELLVSSPPSGTCGDERRGSVSVGLGSRQNHVETPSGTRGQNKRCLESRESAHLAPRKVRPPEQFRKKTKMLLVFAKNRL